VNLGGLGRPSIALALVFASIALLLAVLGAIKKRSSIAESGRRALTMSAVFVAIATISLLTAFFSHDFSLAYVANYSSRSLAGPYMFTALWGGMEGSLLFWTLLLTVFSAIAISRARRWAHPDLSAWTIAVLAGISVFFLVLLNAPADPFTRLASVPLDGRGLNPLLQSPGMLVHPPLLYTGFVGFSVPFAFAMGALLSRRTDSTWFTFTRRWTLFAWSALSIGIVLGGAWAYTELGWGGYWAWDPVENASFMPWLTATAYLHSVVIQEKRRMFKVWNLTLILLTYVLAVFGTFLTRSGLLSSIHTFTEGPIGKWFLPFLALMLIGGLAIIISRLDSLRSHNRLDSLLSRESAFLINNVLFVAAAFAVLWGTLYPIVAEVTTGVRLLVGPPFFDRVFIPLGLALVGLAGLGPLISWRRMQPHAFAKSLRGPLITGAVAIAASLIVGIRSPGVLVAIALCAFTASAVISEFARGSRVHRSRDGLGLLAALGRTLTRNRRRYGGYVVHLGIVLIVIGFIGAAFKTERHAEVAPGGALRIAGYELMYEKLDRDATPEKRIFGATFAVQRDGERIGTLYPQRNFHTAQKQWQSEVAIRSTPIEDLYVVITAFDPDGSASVRAFVNPLTWWIWVGAGVMASGMIFIMAGAAPAPVPADVRRRVREVAVATR